MGLMRIRLKGIGTIIVRYLLDLRPVSYSAIVLYEHYNIIYINFDNSGVS